MWWDKVVEWIDKFTNNPTVIAVTSVLTALAGVIVIFSKTSLGKKALREILNKFSYTDAKVENAKEEIRKAKEELEQYKQTLINEMSQFKQMTENKVIAIYSEYQILKENLFKTLEMIPNQKVQNELVRVREEINSQEQEVVALLGDTYKSIEDRIEEEVVARTAPAQEMIEQLTNELNELKELVNKVVNNDGEEE